MSFLAPIGLAALITLPVILVLHLLNTALNFWLEADPEYPVWTPYTLPSRKLLGDDVPSWPVEDAATTLRIIEAIFASARDGLWKSP